MSGYLKSVLLLVLALRSLTAITCTAFYLERGLQKIYGRSLDWYSDHGAVIFNNRNVKKRAVLPDSTARALEWTSQYSSLTFNQVGVDFPYGGINEKGLVVEALVLNETKYPAPTHDNFATNESQWIQHMLDRAQNIGEVEAYAKTIAIKRVFAVLHYFVCDASGACVVIEFIEGNVKIYRDADLKYSVSTNSNYPQSLENLKKYWDFGGELPMPQDQGSLSRFARAASFSAFFQGTDYITDSFYMIGSVASKSTKWQVVYDWLGEKVYFKTPSAPQRKSLPFPNANPSSCHEPVLTFDLQKQASGDVRAQMLPLTPQMNEDFLGQAKFLPENLKNLVRSYSSECQD